MSETILSKDIFAIMSSLKRRISNLEARALSNRKLLVSVGSTLNKGTDFTDIQNAVDYVDDNGGGTVFIQNGTYTLSADLSLYENVKLEGESRDGVILDFDGGNYQVIATENIVNIESLTVTGSIDSNGALYISAVSNIRLNHVVLDDSVIGLLVDTCQDIVITDVWVSNNSSDGIKLNSNVDVGMFLHCRLIDNGGYGVNIANANCDNNTITNCYFDGNVAGTIDDSGTGTIDANNQI